MKLLKILLLFIFFLLTGFKVHAVEFNLLVLPTDLFSVCDNYFCFPEVSNIMAKDSIDNFKNYEHIKVIELSNVRSKLENNPGLKYKTKTVLNKFAENDTVDFQNLKEIADSFGVKSVLLITSYASNDKVNSRRNLWNILEISSAFRITYPFELKTSAVLTDCVNNVIMWSGKYSKEVSDSDGYYSATNQSQAMSQLEKVKLYSIDNISQNISQNVFMRFFPRDVRTFYVEKKTSEPQATQFTPNALEKLNSPRIRKEAENNNSFDFGNSVDEFIFEF